VKQINQSWHNHISLGLVHLMLYPEVANGEGTVLGNIEKLGTIEKIPDDTCFDAI